MQGKTINGFELKRQLGVGGMAEVWYAENEIHKAAAVKILNAELSNNDQIVERFRTEAEIMVRLNHPNIRQVYSYGNIDGRPAIVMEYLEGEDLKTRMKRGQRFTDEELKKWWNQLVSAMNYTHQKGIVHRDIKPGNIFVDTEGNIKLLDFGIAKVRESISSTQTGQKLGTLMYMSPEQVKDSKHIDYRTDVYSLAVTFVHLLTGKKPYDSDTSSDFEISEQIVYKPLDLSGLPDNWRTFLPSYLEKDPNNRPALKTFIKVQQGGTTKEEENDGTLVMHSTPKNPKLKNTPHIATNNKESHHEDGTQSTKQDDKPKKNTGLTIGIIGLSIVLIVFLFMLLKKKQFDNQTNALCPAVEEGVYGYIDITGSFVIEPTFSKAYPFSEGLAKVSVNLSNIDMEKYGFIDENGKIVISPKYDYAEDYSEGLAVVGVGDWSSRKYGFIDKSGNYAIPAQFDDAGSFHEGLAIVLVKGKYGYIDRKGSYVITPQFEDYGSYGYEFSEGLALAVKNDLFGYIDKSGKFVIEPQFIEACPFSDGVALVGVQSDGGGSKFGFIDHKGKFVIEPIFEYSIGEFSEGLANVTVCAADGCKTGFIDKKGQFVIEPKFDYAGYFREGLAAVEVNGKWGYIDKTGNYVISPTFVCNYGYDNCASEFLNGFAIIDEGKYIIDRTGRVIFEGAIPERIETVEEEMVELTPSFSNYNEKEDAVEEDEVFQIVEEMPDFPGGLEKLQEFLQKNIKYPQEAREKGIQGRVFVQFVVDSDGSISNVSVLRSIGGGCDEEAIRVVKAMPKWKPGKRLGRAVRVSYTLPISFNLSE